MARGLTSLLLISFGSLVLACGDASVGSSLEGRGYGSSANGSSSSGGATTSSSGGSTPTSDPQASSSGDITAPDGGTTPTGSLSCTSCHGDPARTPIAGADPNVKAAPPKAATAGGTAGAHQAHVDDATSVANPIACNECHVVPTSTSHSNGKVDIAFGTLAKSGGATPAFGGTSCSAVYCHGNFEGGNTNAAPTWNGGGMTCTSCHGAPPQTGRHQLSAHLNAGCQACHGTGYSSSAVAKATHINGQKNVGGGGSRISNYNANTGACSTTNCHGTKTW